MSFPHRPWANLNEDEKARFRGMSEEDVIDRWDSEEGEDIKHKIIQVNLRHGSNADYSEFIGTLQLYQNDKKPQYDLRGIDFSSFTNLINDEVFRFDFSNCLLHYSNFYNSDFTSSTFKNSQVLYSDFSGAILEECDFSSTNLTLTDFSNSLLEYANFKNAWLSNVSFNEADLGFLKYNRSTDFHNIDLSKVKGSSNPLFVSFIRSKHFLKHFKEQNFKNKVLYWIWLVISDCGQSFIRWSIVSIVICFLFGLIYAKNQDLLSLPEHRVITPFTFYYFSIVTFTTLGFGDIKIC